MSARAVLLLQALVVTALPPLINYRLMAHLWHATVPRAWDGTGHFAVASIYDRAVFPDTFGWTHAFFAGMPLPNLYPPLFYWCVALLHHTGLFSMEAAFKLCVVVPVLLLPAAVLWTARMLTGRNGLATICSVFVCLPIFIDDRFVMKNPSGIDYVSTFQTGLYSQAFGFVLLLAWYSTYAGLRRKDWRFGLSCLLLALTVLANFFLGMVAAVLVLTTVAADLAARGRRAAGPHTAEGGGKLSLHILCPLVAACLTLFWVVPMLTEYSYFVTRPHTDRLDLMVRSSVWAYYALAAGGAVYWLRRPTRAAFPYLGACLLLAGAVVSSAAAPLWFPFQTARFLTTLNFLLAVPAGYALAGMLSFTSRLARGPAAGPPGGGQTFDYSPRGNLIVTVVFAVLASALLHVHPSYHVVTFYTRETYEQEVEQILRYAAEHKDGRYLVELPSPYFASGAFDGRALSSYLGVQGNESLTVIFREASPHSIFFNPVVNAFSAFPDNFGISTILSDDLDFTSQPLARQIERARLAGVRYFLVSAPAMKDRLDGTPEVIRQRDFGVWSLYVLRDAPPPRVRLMSHRPALVVSRFSLKQRRSEDLDFVRLAEEQYVSGWFDVLLARSPEMRLDHLTELDKFGALIVNEFEAGDADAAYESLKEFARRRPLILLADDAAPLFRRIRASAGDFPRLHIVERDPRGGGKLLSAVVPTTSYRDSATRREWEEIRAVLAQSAEQVEGADRLAFDAETAGEAISLTPQGPLPAAAPVLIETTYYPNWHVEGGGQVYPVTPFFMLVFTEGPVRLVYERRWLDWAGMAVSVATLLGLVAFTAAQTWRARSRPAGA